MKYIFCSLIFTFVCFNAFSDILDDPSGEIWSINAFAQSGCCLAERLDCKWFIGHIDYKDTGFTDGYRRVISNIVSMDDGKQEPETIEYGMNIGGIGKDTKFFSIAGNVDLRVGTALICRDNAEKSPVKITFYLGIPDDYGKKFPVWWKEAVAWRKARPKEVKTSHVLDWLKDGNPMIAIWTLENDQKLLSVEHLTGILFMKRDHFFHSVMISMAIDRLVSSLALGTLQEQTNFTEKVIMRINMEKSLDILQDIAAGYAASDEGRYANSIEKAKNDPEKLARLPYAEKFAPRVMDAIKKRYGEISKNEMPATLKFVLSKYSSV